MHMCILRSDDAKTAKDFHLTILYSFSMFKKFNIRVTDDFNLPLMHFLLPTYCIY